MPEGPSESANRELIRLSRELITETVFDPAAMAVRRTIELPACLLARCSTFGIAVTGDGRMVYVAEPSSDKVHVINTETKEVVASIQVDGAPRGLAITPAPRPATPGSAGVAGEESR